MNAFVRQTDRQTEFSSLDRVCIPCSAVITDITTLQFIRKCRNFMHVTSLQSSGTADYGFGRMTGVYLATCMPFQISKI